MPPLNRSSAGPQAGVEPEITIRTVISGGATGTTRESPRGESDAQASDRTVNPGPRNAKSPACLTDRVADQESCYLSFEQRQASQNARNIDAKLDVVNRHRQAEAIMKRLFPELAGTRRVHGPHQGGHPIRDHPFGEGPPTPAARIVSGAFSPELKSGFLLEVQAEVRG